MIQGGDPTGTGKGGEAIDGGYLDDEIVDTLRHSERGIVAMANRGSNTNGSQFYITYGPMPSLDGHSSIIGRVVDGLSTLDAMERVPVKGKKCRPLQDIVLQCVTIHANPIAQEEVPAAES
ncbi:MAG: Peptidyl-prolyl cis-trans isomerase cyp10, variant 2 [Cercozoa sp. M6MM]